MKMQRRAAVAALVALALTGMAAPAAADDRGYPAATLLSTGTSVVGEPIQYPTGAPAHVTASIINMVPGQRTISHKHGVPLFAYVLQGEFTVDYGAKGKRVYRAGEAFMEAMDVEHFGTNTGTEPVRILAVYLGADGAKNVIPGQ
jgi:quercetin dioxygenase-like cupin family protein